MNNRVFAFYLYIVAAIQTGWTIGSFFTTIFQCWPVDTRWNPHRTKSHCIDFVSSLIALALINTACNAAILILPIPMIYHLQMSRKMKWAFSGIFVLGCA